MAKRSKAPAQRGRLIDIGQIQLSAAGGLIADARHRGRIETRQRAFEEFVERHVTSLPHPLGVIIADCARDGVRVGQGRGRGFRPAAEQAAMEIVRAEAPSIYARHLAIAKESGRHRNWRAWARQKAAEDIRRRLFELRVMNPPSAASITKWKMRFKSPT
jgi:hypothetical protein